MNGWPSETRVTPPANVEPELDPALVAVLSEWEADKKALDAAKAKEMETRKRVVEIGFNPEEVHEGTNRTALSNGYELKYVKKLNYKLQPPVGSSKNTVDAVDDVIEAMARVSNEGAFIADRIFKWSVDLSLSEFRKLEEEAKSDDSKRKLLSLVCDVLEIKEAAPSVDIVPESKRGRR